MEALQNRTLVQNIWKSSEDYIDEWALMSHPGPVFLITSSYLLFVLKLGPDYMKNRPPLSLNNLLVAYNFAQVLVSVFVFSYGVNLLRPVGLVHSVCELSRESTLPVAVGIYYYFSAKLSELLDTIFFVLRKKNNQITFLHVYHHSLMLLSSWWTLKYEPTYTTVFLGTLNSFVHVIMYTYYALSTFPSLTKYLWWKKYITTMQLVQFLLIILQVSANYVVSGCKPSYFLVTTIVGNAILMIYLFSDFYVKAYKQGDKSKSQKENVSCKAKGIKFTNGIQNVSSNKEYEKTL